MRSNIMDYLEEKISVSTMFTEYHGIKNDYIFYQRSLQKQGLMATLSEIRNAVQGH